MANWLKGNKKEFSGSWISVSDLMSGLMLIFLMIAIFFMAEVQKDKVETDEIVKLYDDLKISLYQDLYKEFQFDLKDWGAEIERETLTIRFREPDVLFSSGQSTLQPRFKNILDSFFPRYINVLRKPKYQKTIEEIRIEGHTSSDWTGATTADQAYLHNMNLSHNRTKSVLTYVLNSPHPTLILGKRWIRQRVTANGLSSSKLVMENGKENKGRSRRVEFRIRTNAEEQMARLLSKIAQIEPVSPLPTRKKSPVLVKREPTEVMYRTRYSQEELATLTPHDKAMLSK